MDTKEIAAKIRSDLKAELPFCKINVKMSRFAGGSSIGVRVMTAPFQVFEQPHSEHQFDLNSFDSDYADRWANGTRLTQEGWDLMAKVAEVVKRYHWDKSDIQSDFFCTNFYAGIGFGDWQNGFKVVEK